MVKKEIKSSFILPYVDPRAMTEQFKSEVEIKQVRFPKELGEEHPFNLKMCEDACDKYGILQAIVDKYLNYILPQEFVTRSDNKKAKEIIDKFVDESDFQVVLREWIESGLKKGGGYMEIAESKSDIAVRCLNATHMYNKRNRKGELFGYNQYVGGFDKFNINKVIPFEPHEIVYLPIARSGGSPYGRGIIYRLLTIVDNLIRSEKDMHTLIGRKANAPIWAKVGTIEEPASQTDVTAVGQQFEWLNNMHEWAFDHKVDLKVLDFGNLSEKFATVLEHDLDMLFFAAQIAAVLMGKANVPEGLAEEQKDDFERRIQAMQLYIENIIEDQIFRRVLAMNGINARVEIEWKLPSDKSINERIDRLAIILNNPMISPEMRSLVERDIAENLGFDIDELPDPKEARKDANERERKKEEEIKQPELPGEKELSKINIKTTDSLPNAIRESMPTKEELQRIQEKDYTLQEWVNFDYQKFISDIVGFIKKDKFEDLAAANLNEIEMGKLSQGQVSQVKKILIKNFKTGGTIRDIENDLSKIGIGDRFNMQDGQKILEIPAENRPIIIARTEATRVAAHGALENYQDKGVKKISWLAALSNRTCPICENLNGKIMDADNPEILPGDPHPFCRCTIIPVTE